MIYLSGVSSPVTAHLCCSICWLVAVFLSAPHFCHHLVNALRSMFDKVLNTHSWSEVSVVPFTKKILMNKKVCHDGTYEDYDPNFDIFQEVQSQNNFCTTQLNVMGYKGDTLKLQFTEIKFWRGRLPQLSQYPSLTRAKRLSPPQIDTTRSFLSWEGSMSPPMTCSQWQK
jgi:hypothetical protein